VDRYFTRRDVKSRLVVVAKSSRARNSRARLSWRPRARGYGISSTWILLPLRHHLPALRDVIAAGEEAVPPEGLKECIRFASLLG
jgi:hypothetical protein